jgi:hypothetical protein
MPTKEKERKFKIPKSPKQFTNFFKSKPHFAKSTLEQLCILLEQVANEQLLSDCAAKHFTVDSIFMPCGEDIDLAPGDISTGERCAPVELPVIRPCFKLQWGDGPDDRIETDDVEVFCLTAWNPYSNLIIKDLTAFIIITDETGSSPETLPDGTPSVIVKPYAMICFGDIPPCDESKPAELSAVSRELTLISRGAKDGAYFVWVAYCYSVELPLAFGSIFPIDLVKS